MDWMATSQFKRLLMESWKYLETKYKIVQPFASFKVDQFCGKISMF